MPLSFWGPYLAKLGVLGALLFGLYAIAQRLKAAFVRSGRRYVDVIESTMLSQHAAVHLLRVGSSYLLVGGGAAGLSKLAEFSTSELGAAETKPRST